MHRIFQGAPAKVVLSAAALVSVFLPWLDRTVPGPRVPLNAFQLSPLTWAWIVLDVMVIVGLIRFWSKGSPPWLNIAWAFLGAVSFGVGLSGLVFLHVAAMVSDDLGAPTPVALAYGSAIFGIISLLWIGLAVFEAFRLAFRASASPRG
ncbi:MAG: hypothetical protein OWU84_12350 [Firmicutes bacterium]|nr:hypothetical protein [Bacillota bacterium]